MIIIIRSAADAAYYGRSWRFEVEIGDEEGEPDGWEYHA